MKLSIVVTVLNDERIEKLLLSLQNHKVKSETIVVDAGSTDCTPTIVSLFPPVKLYHANEVLRGAGKNIGAHLATGDFIAFLDSDTEVTADWYPELVKSSKHSDIIAGYSPDPKKKFLPRVSIHAKGNDITYPTCNIAYRKSVFDEVGYFNEDMVTAEDIEFNYRCVKQGYNIHYNPKMKVYHSHRQSFMGFAKQAYWNGFGRKQLNQLHPELKHLHELPTKNILRLGFGFLGYVFGRKK